MATRHKSFEQRGQRATWSCLRRLISLRFAGWLRMTFIRRGCLRLKASVRNPRGPVLMISSRIPLRRLLIACWLRCSVEVHVASFFCAWPIAPNEASELASNRGDRLLLAHPAANHPRVAPMQALLRLPGDIADRGWHALIPLTNSRAH